MKIKAVVASFSPIYSYYLLLINRRTSSAKRIALIVRETMPANLLILKRVSLKSEDTSCTLGVGNLTFENTGYRVVGKVQLASWRLIQRKLQMLVNFINHEVHELSKSRAVAKVTF